MAEWIKAGPRKKNVPRPANLRNKIKITNPVAKVAPAKNNTQVGKSNKKN